MSNNIDLKLSTSITNMALVNAANALGKMIKEEVILHHFRVNPTEWAWETGGKELYVLRTDIKGDFAGEVYLIVLPKDEPIISELLLPNSVIGQPEMREAILLEIDNILTASIVTKYSEVLRKQIIGDVPEAQRYTESSLRQYFASKVSTNQHTFTFSSELITFRSQLQLYFAGFFDERFVEDVKEAATNPDYHHKSDTEEENTYISKATKGLFRKILPW